MQGMDRTTGASIEGLEHLRQSLGDLLTTPIGTRVMRRDYGFDGEIMDKPMNAETMADVFMAVAEAVDAWEPRFVLTRVRLSEGGAQGRAVFDLDGIYLINGQAVTMEGIEL